MEEHTTKLAEANRALQGEVAALEEAHAEQEGTIRLQELINRATSTRELMHLVTDYFRNWLKCDAVGIRLREGEDFPYYETKGFPESFVLAENSLCITDPTGEMVRDNAGNAVLVCMCGTVISGRFDRSKPFFTERGSFWTNCTTKLLASTTEADRQARTRDRCNGEGYESVGLFPLRVGTEPYGLLQINAKRTGLFSPARVACLERLGGFLAIALSQRRTEEALRESKKALRGSNRALSVLGQGNEALVHATSESNLLQDICRILVEKGGYRLAWVGFAEQDAAKSVRAVAQMGYEDRRPPRGAAPSPS